MLPNVKTILAMARTYNDDLTKAYIWDDRRHHARAHTHTPWRLLVVVAAVASFMTFALTSLTAAVQFSRLAVDASQPRVEDVAYCKSRLGPPPLPGSLLTLSTKTASLSSLKRHFATTCMAWSIKRALDTDTRTKNGMQTCIPVRP